MCNLFPKNEFSIKQHSGNKLFFFALEVDHNSLSACVQFTKGFELIGKYSVRFTFAAGAK